MDRQSLISESLMLETGPLEAGLPDTPGVTAVPPRRPLAMIPQSIETWTLARLLSAGLTALLAAFFPKRLRRA